MDLTKLPENPKNKEEEFALQQAIEKSFLHPLESTQRVQFEQLFSSVPVEQIPSITYALLLCLHAHLSSNSPVVLGGDKDFSLAYLARFFEFAEAKQIRKLQQEFEAVVRCFAVQCCRNHNKTHEAVRACGSLLLAVEKLSNGEWQVLTPVHCDLLQVCIVGKMYPLAVTFVDTVCGQRESVCVSPLRKTALLQSAKYTMLHFALDVQRFFYYAGIAYAAMEHFHEAKRMLLECLALPSKTASGVQFEAFKKYWLLCLVCTGASPLPLPPYCSPAVIKQFGHEDSFANTAYQALQQAFTNDDLGAAMQEVCTEQRFVTEFTRSGNFGLVEQVQTSYVKMRVVKLTDTYLTLGYAELETQLGLPQSKLEMCLSQMIGKREISASLDQKLSMVRFLDEPLHGEVAKLEDELVKMQNLSQDLRNFDTRLSTSKQYIRGMSLGRSTKRTPMEEESA